jgi:hypothetical protein
LNLVGIYPEQIEDVIDTCENLCKEHGIDSNELWTCIWQDMDEYWHTEDMCLSDQIVGVVFENLQKSLKAKGIRSDYYVNGTLDTSFYIDGEEQ